MRNFARHFGTATTKFRFGERNFARHFVSVRTKFFWGERNFEQHFISPSEISREISLIIHFITKVLKEAVSFAAKLKVDGMTLEIL